MTKPALSELKAAMLLAGFVHNKHWGSEPNAAFWDWDGSGPPDLDAGVFVLESYGVPFDYPDKHYNPQFLVTPSGREHIDYER